MRWMGYGGLAAGAIALTPIITQAVAMQGGAAKALAQSAISSCGSGIPSGWAASIAEGIGQVPLVGGALAAGGYATIGASAALAIGGMLFGNYLDKQTPPEGFPWGRVVRWGCLITSALVAAPIVLSGLSMGLTFLSSYAAVYGYSAISSLAAFASSTFGTLGVSGALTGSAMAQGSAAMMTVHALTCALPIGASVFLFGKKRPADEVRSMPTLDLPPLTREHHGRVTQPSLQLATN